MQNFAFLLLALALPTLGAAAPLAGVLTVVEGDAVVIRDAVRFPAAEGLRLQTDDIVHTGAKARHVRLEFAEGGALDLGPATRVLLRPRFVLPRTERPAHLYLLQGWAKLTAGPAGKIGLASPRLDLTEVAAAAVVRVGEGGTFLFVEAGTARLTEHLDSLPARTRSMSEGEAYERRGAVPGNEMGAVISRAAPDILKGMPRPFADTLPMRAHKFKDMQLTPAAPQDIAYDDVAGWLHAEWSLRPAFVQRWAAKARDTQFRSALVANLRAHPEWSRVLFPEKIAAKPRPATAVVAARPASAAVLLAAAPASVAAVKPAAAGKSPLGATPAATVPNTVATTTPFAAAATPLIVTAEERERDVVGRWQFRQQ